ncbi:ABC-2 type transport system permease protein [Cryobacterium mesophilum]|uniref:Multidrug ABC transporter permease n=1 Tax=Terrimesophilobacter mesophilus TaxID=433647 RepID=A0A4R8V8I8_9MICO|nr:ABC transporter permease [Terrimesophilobacter mesophilus]MBB5632134.1 ABC-2 type transport system permease protein [Terrimesophilobacter mesophilus]TFB79003.1 multidrug ABC transporter permease [Terrimesophilobacter mesophilus]
MKSSALAGTAPLLRTLVRHDGRNFAPWVVIVTALTTSSVLVYPWVFPDQQDRAGLAVAVGANPAIGLIFGPAFDLSTTDGFNAWRTLALGGFLAALGTIFAVTRATRGQEDSGQAELLASGVLGRAGRLLAAVGLALIASVMLGVIAAVATALCGGGWEASLLLGATFTATGWMFAAIAAVAAQIGSDVRTANSIATATLGILFLLRGFAYSVSAPEWTIWANPLGWMTETRPATENNWWPLWYALAFTVVVLAVAFALQARRDFGEGAIAPRPGPERGRVRSTWRLAFRLNRGALTTWTIAFVALGVVFGFFATSINDILGSDNAVKQFLAAGATTPHALISAFLVTILSLLGIIACIPGVQLMLRVRTEELEDRVEPIMATRVRRPVYYAGNAVLAFALSAVCILIAGTLIAVLASTADIGVEFGDALLQVVVTVPAVWTVVAVSVAVVGARPHVLLAAWLGVLASFALTVLGPTFKLWDWILAISPFWHVPNVTDADADWFGLVWISLVTLFFLLVGFVGFRRRDLAR